MDQKGKITEADVLALLARHFAAPGYAFIPHVRNGTGFRQRTTRTADAIAMSLWPSRGLHLHGFEVKVDRSDWVRELRDPAKADDMFDYFDFWWLVVSDRKIVADGELPPTWGLIEARDKVRIAVPAPAISTPRPLDRIFLAAILRRATESLLPDAKLKEEFERGRRAGLQDKREEKHYVLESLQANVAEFEKASGIQIANGWNLGPVGEAVMILRSLTPEAIRARLDDLRRRFALSLEQIDLVRAEAAKWGIGSENTPEIPECDRP